MITITAGYDVEVLRGILALWTEWAREGDRELDQHLWVQQFNSYIAGGRWIPMLAWDGPRPVACVDFLFHTSALDGKSYCYGDQAFVTASHRGRGIFTQILAQALALLPMLDVNYVMAPVNISGESADMTRMYHRMGFRDQAKHMRWEVR